MKIQKITLLAGFFLLSTAAHLCAQSVGLVVNSNPPGAQVVVKGDAELAGVTPTRFQQRLIGTYNITVKKSGYESYSTKLVLDPSREATVDATLTPKSAMKAGLRSLFIPGWGQRYSEKKTKGYLFTIGAALAAGGFLIADGNFNNKFDDYEIALDRYNNATTDERRRQLFPELQSAQNHAYDAENMRRVAIGVFAGVWALNVLDALLFFPHDHDDEEITTQKLSITPQTDFNTVGVQLSVAF